MGAAFDTSNIVISRDRSIYYSMGAVGSHLVIVLDVSASMKANFEQALRSVDTYLDKYDRISIILASNIPISFLQSGSNGDYPFTVIVRSSGTYQGPLQVYADNKLIYRDTIMVSRSSSIKIAHAFSRMGTHILRSSIASDIQPLNNDYQKAIYVIPKPQVLLISEKESPLATILSDLYELTQTKEITTDLKDYKAVVLDDQGYRKEFDRLNEFVTDGGGLVVVGGANSFELGGYYNSSLEKSGLL